MKLHIDICEKKIIGLIEALQDDLDIHIDTCIERLPVGDFIIKDDTGKECLIIERKSLNDLASSIVDGRYAEQSFRLNQCELHNHNIMYIIEGDMSTYRNKYSRITKQALYSSMVTLQYFKGFNVFRTMSIVETTTYLIRLTDKLRREYKKGNEAFYSSAISPSCVDDTNEVTSYSTPTATPVATPNDYVEQKYSNVTSRVKKSNIRPDNIGEIILSQIPGISKATSSAVMSHVGSLYNLMIQIEADRHCLDDVTYTTKTNKKRHISKKSIESIIEYLLYQKSNTIHIDDLDDIDELDGENVMG